METKTCRICGKEKPLTLEYWYRVKNKYWRRKCRECENRDRLVNYHKRGTGPEYNRRMREKRRELLSSIKQARGCEKCGWNEHWSALDFHHPDPSVKEVSIGTGYRVSLPVLMQEIAKCQVLCSNCHRRLHYDARYGG